VAFSPRLSRRRREQLQFRQNDFQDRRRKSIKIRYDQSNTTKNLRSRCRFVHVNFENSRKGRTQIDVCQVNYYSRLKYNKTLLCVRQCGINVNVKPKFELILQMIVSIILYIIMCVCSRSQALRSAQNNEHQFNLAGRQ